MKGFEGIVFSGTEVASVGSGGALVSFGHGLECRRTRGFNALQLDTYIPTSWDLGGLLLVEIDKLPARGLGDTPLVTEGGVGHPTTEGQSLNHGLIGGGCL